MKLFYYIKNKKELDTYKAFTSEQELKDFLKQYYEHFLHNLPQNEVIKLISSHSHGLSYKDAYDCKIIDTIKEVLNRNDIPLTPYDIVLYRGDDANFYKDKTRPFLAHTFLKQSAKKFTQKDKIYKIFVPAGSKILPTCGLDCMGAFPEEEVILETDKLIKISRFSFIYCNK